MRIQIIILTVIVCANSERCTTPNDETAECISLYACPVLLTSLGRLKNESFEFVRSSNCGGTPSEPRVCCGTTGGLHEKITVKSPPRSLLPNRRVCGYQHSDDYVSVRNGTGIDEFPWLVWIQRVPEKSGDERIHKNVPLCSGSLINNKYVLTAAQCVKNLTIQMVGVRLGEHFVENRTSCVYDDEMMIEECSEAEEYGIAKIIIHPGYVLEKNHHDIALLRLNKTVKFTDYIRPICLPSPETKMSEIDEIATSSGWGFLNTNNHLAKYKKKVLTKIISNEDCAKRFSNFSIVEIIDQQLCTSRYANDDDKQLLCIGDGGGPVMLVRRFQWHQEGIISATFGGCGSLYPIMNTRVVQYMDWIGDNLEA